VHTAPDGLAVEETVGVGLTVIVVVAVFVQPLALVPVTVYVVVARGVNGTPFVTPPVHVYVVAPVPFSVTAVPLHTVVPGDAVEDTAGNGFTTTVIVAVFVHPLKSDPVTVYVAVDAGTNPTPSVTLQHHV
jgi:hypothetical protein